MEQPITNASLMHPPGRGEIVLQREGLRVVHLVLNAGSELPDTTAVDDVVFLVTRGKGVIYDMQEPRHVEACDVIDVGTGETYSIEAIDELEMTIVHATLVQPAPH